MKLPWIPLWWSLTTTKAGENMKILLIILAVLLALFLLTVVIYWFNLDTKIVKLIEKPMMKHYDNIKRDHRL